MLIPKGQFAGKNPVDVGTYDLCMLFAQDYDLQGGIIWEIDAELQRRRNSGIDKEEFARATKELTEYYENVRTENDRRN